MRFYPQACQSFRRTKTGKLRMSTRPHLVAVSRKRTNLVALLALGAGATRDEACARPGEAAGAPTRLLAKRTCSYKL